MQRIAILYDASQAVLSTFELDEVLNRILEIARDYFQVQNGAILLLDAEKQELFVRAHFGRHEASAGVRVPLGTGLTGTAVAEKRPVYASDVRQDPRYVGSIPETRSEVALPLMLRNEVVGVLDFQSDKVDFFDPEMVDLLTLFAMQASIALQNAKLYSLEQKRAAQLEAINAIARQTTSVLETAELLDKVCSAVLEAFPVDHVAVLLLEDDRLIFRAHRGRLTQHMQLGDEVPPGQGLSGRALATKKVVLENDVAAVPGYVAGFDETRSEMCLPLISFGQTVGVLAVESSRVGAFEEADAGPLESVADICAAAIQNARNFEQVKRMAYVDGLTGIFNRRFFELRMAEELERATRYPAGMSIIMLDIDHFKKLNDEFGHLLGDEVLRQVSTLLQQQLRKVDVLCRYGGEEFAILVPATSGEKAVGVAEKLRRVVGSHDFPGVPRPVTISAGVADYPTHGKTRDELVGAADSALYAAKQAGRNCVVAAGSERASAVSDER
jgi:diguanylate cyclase (GGDEF)-like protein